EGRRKRVRLSTGSGRSKDGEATAASVSTSSVDVVKQVPKIKLSLKLAAAADDDDDQDDGYYYEDGHEMYGDEDVDIDEPSEQEHEQDYEYDEPVVRGGSTSVQPVAHNNTSVQQQPLNATGGSVVRHSGSGSGSHTPRLKLRFSLKKKDSPADDISGRAAVPLSAPEAAHGVSTSGWGGSGYPGTAASSSSTSPAYVHRRMASTASLGSEAESEVSEMEGAARQQTASVSGGRRRGRPAGRGRRSSSVSSYRARDGTPMALRLPSNPATTTVSLNKSLTRLIDRIKKRDDYGLFQEPVDTRAVPDYLSVISRPMDLGTIKQRVEGGAYTSIYEFRADVLLVCENARVFNGEESFYAVKAGDLERYAVGAIDRETAKLEARGMASAGDACGGLEARGSATPSVADGEFADAYGGSGQFRRSARRRQRGDAADGAVAAAGAVAGVTAAGTADLFRWSDEGKKKYKRASAGPKRLTEALVRVKVLGDGSVDPAGFEEDVALLAYDHGCVRRPVLSRGGGGGFAPATGADFGPYAVCGRPTVAGMTAALAEPGGGALLQPVHGDALGLAYWRSIGDFIDGAGPAAAQYASSVMQHLTCGAYRTACATLAEMRGEPNETVDVPGVDVRGVVRWLDTRAVRDRLYAERVDALCGRVVLGELQRGVPGGVAPMDAAQKDAGFRRVSALVRALAEDAGTGDERAALEQQARGGICRLAEQMCLALAGSCQPTALVPGLPHPSLSRNAGARAAIAPRPGRAASTPQFH
ncbi:hypothetical protein GGI05_002895, partial [Coemansia sp. RSA 2603]